MSSCYYFITLHSPRATRALQDCKDNNVEIANFLLVSCVCVCVCVHVTTWIVYASIRSAS